MNGLVRQSTGQEDLDNSYLVAKHSQDMAKVIRQAIAAHAPNCSQYAMVIIVLHFMTTKASSRICSVTPEQSARYILSTIRRCTRRNDLVWLKDTTYYFLLPEANLQGANIVQDRLWKALQQNTLTLDETEAIPLCNMTIGYSAYPKPSHTLEECINDAQVVQRQFEPLYHDNEAEHVLSLPELDLSMMARHFGVPYLSFLPRTFPNKVKRLVRLELAQELHCFPLGCTSNTLTVAMSNPQDSQVLNRLESETGMRIFPVLTHPDELENALEHINI